ncbi:MAG: hypothetical protein SA339_06475 [Methanomassiliicoccus sp.]|nr:hypothetical protein [Methanomassiliicoccus sp.]
MASRAFVRIREFYKRNLPIGDYLGEMFYAVWMVVVSLGILGGTGFEGGAIAYVVFIAFAVNTAWGLIDGLTVMHTNIIERSKSDKAIFDLQTKGDAGSRDAGMDALSEGITSTLSTDERGKVLDLISGSAPLKDNPYTKRYRPCKEDWTYALGILSIDFLLVIPLVFPFLIFSQTSVALYVSRMISTLLFAIIGAAYAKNMNRRRWVAALFLGTLCTSLFSLAFLAGW